jgi:hypothetical protein
MAQAQDVLSELPRATWRDIEFPIVDRDAGFRHVTIEHHVQYRGDAVENLGPHAWQVTYVIPMRQGIVGYGNLYTDTFPKFLESFLDKSAGTLVDPELGELQVIPGELKIKTDPLRRDGSDLTVTFIDARDLSEDIEVQAADIESEALAFSEEIEKADWEDEPIPPLPINPLLALASAGEQLNAQGNKVASALGQVSYSCERVEESAEKLEDPASIGQIQRSSRRLNIVARRTNDKLANPAREVRQSTLRVAKGLSAIASDFGMTYDELLEINPTLGTDPEVPAGVSVNYYAANGSSA